MNKFNKKQQINCKKCKKVKNMEMESLKNKLNSSRLILTQTMRIKETKKVKK